MDIESLHQNEPLNCDTRRISHDISEKLALKPQGIHAQCYYDYYGYYFSFIVRRFVWEPFSRRGHRQQDGRRYNIRIPARAGSRRLNGGPRRVVTVLARTAAVAPRTPGVGTRAVWCTYLVPSGRRKRHGGLRTSRHDDGDGNPYRDRATNTHTLTHKHARARTRIERRR